MNNSPPYISKQNLNHENKIFLLMISNGAGWHYIALKKQLALLRGIASKNNGDFYCLSCLHFFRTKRKLESHQNVCEINTFLML